MTDLPTIVEWSCLSPAERRTVLRRPVQENEADLTERVRSILNAVRDGGDAALTELTERYDRVHLSAVQLSAEQLEQQAERILPVVKAALDRAYDSIYALHAAQEPQAVCLQTMQGVACELRYAPLRSAGLYVPGGSAVLPSTVLMLGIPAAIAGVGRTVLCSPPNREGLLSPAVCYAALKVGATEVWRVGGAQAVAALAYGTETLEPVDKIFGPGNAYVTAAKTLVSTEGGGPAIDLPAGPSELLIVADGSAEPAFVAADLLSQAEHGPDSQVMVVSPDREMLEQTRRELARQLGTLPRADIAARALGKSRLILTEDLGEAVAVADAYAPEHLSLQLRDAYNYAGQICAGSVFVGHLTPESGGDYATGTNHVLPTYGAARAYSSLSLLDFYRRYTVQQLTHEGLKALTPTVATLAREEGLEAHARAAEIRLELADDSGHDTAPYVQTPSTNSGAPS